MDTDDFMQRVGMQLDRISDTLSDQNARMASMETDLRFHIQRSERLEKIVEQHEKYFWFAMGAISLAGPLVTKLLQVVFK